MLTDEQRERLNSLYSIANNVQNLPEYEIWANQIKSALSYVLHGDERYEYALEKVKTAR